MDRGLARKRFLPHSTAAFAVGMLFGVTAWALSAQTVVTRHVGSSIATPWRFDLSGSSVEQAAYISEVPSTTESTTVFAGDAIPPSRLASKPPSADTSDAQLMPAPAAPAQTVPTQGLAAQPAPLPAAPTLGPPTAALPVPVLAANTSAATVTADAAQSMSAISSAATTSVPANVAVTPSSTAAGDAAVGIDTSLSVDQLQSRVKQIAGNADIPPELKTQLTTLYESTIEEVKRRVDSEKRGGDYTTRAEIAPTAIAEARKRLAASKSETTPTDGKANLRRITLEELQSSLQQRQSNLQAAADARAAAEAKINTRDARKKIILKSISDEKANQTKLNDEIKALPSESVDSRVVEARSLLARSRLAASVATVRELEQELRSYEAESELLPLQKELATAEERAQQAAIKDLQSELGSRRETKIEDLRYRINRILASDPTPADRAVAQSILTLTDKWHEVIRNSRKVVSESEASQKRRDMWSERFNNMVDRIGPVDNGSVDRLSSWIGLLLRRQRMELPNLRRLHQELADYQNHMQETGNTLLELEDWLARLEGEPVNASEDPLRATELEILSDFRLDANEYFNSLGTLCEQKENMIGTVVAYRHYIDQHVLWIPSCDPLKKSHFAQLWPAIGWLFQADSLLGAGQTLLNVMRSHIPEMLFVTAAWLVLVFNQRKLRNRIRELGDQAARNSQTSFMPTFKVAVLTLLISLPLPAALAYVGLRLYAADGATPYTQQLGIGVAFTARYFIVLEVLRQICRNAGLAEKHLGWSSHATAQTRRHLRWFLDLTLPLVAVVAMTNDGGDELFENSLGRVVFVVFLLTTALMFGRLLHPRTGAIRDYVAMNRGGWVDRLRYIWYSAAVAAPVILATGSGFGFHYTAVSLALLLHRSTMTVLGLFVLYSLCARAILLSRRSLAIAQARQRLEDAQRESSLAAAGSHGDVRSLEYRNEVRNEQNAIDLATINAQTMSLLRAAAFVAILTSLYCIWTDVLPAVNAFNAIELWPSVAEGGKAITLREMLLAIPIGFLTILAVRNIPGLLEVALLQHLPIENAMRYAITTVFRYLLLVVGIMKTSECLGFSWSSVQWLVAALGVGLGFGLQEIFANFVSGLILLFEQPIRVGDIITIGDTSGAVARIRMRATTITNWDRQELVVPNKDLITGRLLNWTLSDSTNRMVLTFGIAFGSDTDLACQILRDACAEHPNVLNDPEPTAFFEGFTDNNLTLTLRFFLQTLDTRLTTRHELLSVIHRRFAEAGLEIAFPQRDLHLRSLPDSLDRFLKAVNSETSERAPRKAG